MNKKSFIPKLLNGGFSTCFSKWQAFKLATLSGFAEPLGVIIVGMSSDKRNLKISFFYNCYSKCGFTPLKVSNLSGYCCVQKLSYLLN